MCEHIYAKSGVCGSEELCGTGSLLPPDKIISMFRIFFN